jgi:hypothetical protein
MKRQRTDDNTARSLPAQQRASEAGRRAMMINSHFLFSVIITSPGAKTQQTKIKTQGPEHIEEEKAQKTRFFASM